MLLYYRFPVRLTMRVINFFVYLCSSYELMCIFNMGTLASEISMLGHSITFFLNVYIILLLPTTQNTG